MSQPAPHGIDRHSLGADFAADEVQKSNLILEGQLLLAQQLDAAADRFAQAAAIEERLSAQCAAQGLPEKSQLHLFSAASCWARAGNFYEAICLGEQLLSRTDLAPRLRARVQALDHELRQRREQWTAGLVLISSAE